MISNINTTVKSNCYQTTFTSKRKPEQSFECFEEIYHSQNLDSNLSSIIADKSNYLSEGRFNKIYKIPNNHDYLLKFYKGINPENLHEFKSGLTKQHDMFPKINFGQPIADLGKFMLVLLRQNGYEYSIPFNLRQNAGQSEIKKYLSDIMKLSKISQDSYNNFTDEIKELVNKNCYIDYFNSNNLLISDDEINIVDIIKIKRLKQKAFMFPSKESLMKIFADENVLPFILKDLSAAQRNSLSENLEIISEKTSKALEHSKLPENKLKTTVIDFFMDNFWHGHNKRFKSALKAVCNK